MTICETDPAWWAIVLSYCMITCFTAGIGVREGALDTISSMVALSELTLNGFAMVTVAMLACQVYWVYSQVQRWSKAMAPTVLEHGSSAGAPPLGPKARSWSLHPVASTCIAVGAICGTVGTLGFGIASTTLHPHAHVRFAASSFIGSILYLCGFAVLASSARSGARVHSLTYAVCLIGVSISSLVSLAAGYPFWHEYILVTALHFAALALTIPMEHRLLYYIL